MNSFSQHNVYIYIGSKAEIGQRCHMSYLAHRGPFCSRSRTDSHIREETNHGFGIYAY